MAELYLPPIRLKYNPTNGQFLKGHVPANKGKKWADYMSEDAIRRARRGWRNLEVHRPTRRADNAGRCRKAVVAVFDDGKIMMFPYLKSAALFVGGNRENVGRCCRENASGKKLHKPWSIRNGGEADKAANTDHRYKGIRFYFESDFHIWKSKFKKD